MLIGRERAGGKPMNKGAKMDAIEARLWTRMASDMFDRRVGRKRREAGISARDFAQIVAQCPPNYCGPSRRRHKTVG
jgi:hypothetical protein